MRDGLEKEFILPLISCMSREGEEGREGGRRREEGRRAGEGGGEQGLIFFHRYAIPYFSKKQDPTLIISYIIPGNTFPVVEDPSSENNLVGYVVQE
jgi:hypothetical protein